MCEKVYEDEVFQDLLSVVNNLNLSNHFNISLDERAFIAADDIVILIPCNQECRNFQIIDLKRKNGIHDPFQEVFVDLDQLSIGFYGKAGRGKRKLLISATYDQDDDIWDVRSHVKGNSRPSTLDDALDDLLLVENDGLEQRESFISIINLCQHLAKNSKEQKTLKK